MRELTIWTGLLYKSDGRTVDTIQEWEANGSFRNQRGVSSPHDLALFMRPLTDAELQAGLERLPASARPAPAPVTAIDESKPAAEVQPEAQPVEAAIVDPVKDPRLGSHLAEITWNTFQEAIGEAVSLGILPKDVVISSIRGPWAELIASTLVSYLDNPEPKPAAKEPPPLPQQPPAAEPGRTDLAGHGDAEVKSDTGEVKLPGSDDPEKPPA